MTRYSLLARLTVARRRVARRLSVAAVLGALAFACAAALATTPGTNGQITFRRWFNQAQTRSAIFTMNADGTNIRRITHAPRHTHDDQADWAPDGKRLVFTRFPDNGPAFIDIVNADGSGLRRVTPRCTRRRLPDAVPAGCEDAANVSFTPNGQRVTFSRATGHVRHFPRFGWDQIEHSAIAIIGVDGSGQREILRLPRYSGDANFPQMSPDGRYIEFERDNSPLSKPRLGIALFVMNADGSGLHRVTPWNLRGGDNPDWAPDSSRILFHSGVDVNNSRSQYYTVRPDGSGLTQLTHFPNRRRLFSASFSPDGHQIVFARADSAGNGDIWIMNADGSNPHPVQQAKPADSAPDWASAG
jgi:TolB protein